MKPWFYVVLVPWIAFMIFGVLTFLDFGFDAVVITENGPQFWIHVLVDVVLFGLPVILFPFARKKRPQI